MFNSNGFHKFYALGARPYDPIFVRPRQTASPFRHYWISHCW